MKKRLAIVLSILILMGIIFPSFTAFAQPTKTPHENPATATGSLNKISLLLNYGKIIFLASNRQYSDALAALEELRKIDIPEEFRNIIDRYNDLCQQLFITLDSLDIILDETASLIERNKIREARINLEKAEVYVRDAEIILKDLSSAMDSLSRSFGVFAPSVSDELREAYKRLGDSMKLLQELLNILANLKLSLDEIYKIYTEIKDKKNFEIYIEIKGEKYIEIKGLLPTSLTLNISPTSTYVGDTINVSGLLQSYDEPLAGRSVSILLDEDIIATILVQEGGSYSGNITVPFNYKETMNVVTIYEPQGSDADKYLACQSPEVTLYTRFYPTTLKLSTPAIVYPDIPFNIDGEVISDANNSERTLEVTSDNLQIAETTVSGKFNLEISLPDDISPGQRSLTVTVTPQDRYAGISEQRNITVALIPLEIDLQTPGLIFLPKSIQFDGRIQSEMGPISDANINLIFNDISTTARTASDGSFTSTLDMPLDFSFMGQREITINIEPMEPWAGSISIKRQVFFINPVFTGFTLLAVPGLIIIFLRRHRTTNEKSVPQGEVIRFPAFITPQVSATKLTGVKGRIISAYRTGLLIIEKITGVRMTPDITLREFLAMVTKLLPRITRQLTELTVMAESALYSNQNPPGKTANTAEQITDDIKKELYRGD